MRVLYTSSQVRNEIDKLFHDPRRERIAVVPFVGDGAEAVLPSPKGLRLICTPTPGATSPRALRGLISRGSKVEFADSIHMKVYWAKGRGAVVTSANLSRNALGSGGLKEVGVFLDAAGFDIKRILCQLKTRPAESELLTLDAGDKDFRARNGWGNLKRPDSITFDEWHDSPTRERWKIFLYSESSSMPLSRSTVKEIEDSYGRRSAHGWFWSSRPVARNEWILLGRKSRAGLRHLSWQFSTRVHKVAKSDPVFASEAPYEVVQVHESGYYPPPPFAERTPGLRRALARALLDRIASEDDVLHPVELTTRELDAIAQELRTNPT